MISITLPDGNIKAFESAVSGRDLALSISEGLARNSVAMELDGRLVDLDTPIRQDAKVRIVTPRDPEALEVMRHSAAHVMAQAILRLYPEAKLTIGPVVEDGFYYDIDMPPVSDEDFPRIEVEIQKIVKAKLPIRRREVSKTEALDAYKHEPYKLEMIQELQDGTISLYEQGEFTDLCRGPHVPHTGFVKAIKLLKVSGAYWRADPARAQLQRIYGTGLLRQEGARRLPHVHRRGQAAQLPQDRPGARPVQLPRRGARDGLLPPQGDGHLERCRRAYRRLEHLAAGYVETKTPIILNRALWERSGHWANYRENMYTTTIDETEYAIKPMNCPGGMLLYNRKPHSYRDLPVRAAEIGLVHRHELSGVLSGLFRVRAFHQDDAHIFMRPEQIQQEILGGAAPHRAHLRIFRARVPPRALDPTQEVDRDRRAVGTATNGQVAPEAYGRDYKLNEGDGAFYGPKIDIHINDALGRTWQCGTIQLDMSQPERFNLHYVDADNERKRPIMIHRAIYGSVERFLGILIEHFAGRFPLWLAPVQAVILPMNDELTAYAESVKARFDAAGLRDRSVDRPHREPQPQGSRGPSIDQVLDVTIRREGEGQRPVAARTRTAR